MNFGLESTRVSVVSLRLNSSSFSLGPGFPRLELKLSVDANLSSNLAAVSQTECLRPPTPRRPRNRGVHPTR